MERGARVPDLRGQIALGEAGLQHEQLFVIVLVGMILTHSTVNNWGKQFVSAAISNATALQSMADAMQRISQREDERDRERELALDHLAYTAQQILTKVESVDGKFDSLDGKVQVIEEGCRAAMCIPKATGGTQ